MDDMVRALDGDFTIAHQDKRGDGLSPVPAPPDQDEVFSNVIPKAIFEIILGAGHIAGIKQPSVVTSILREFMHQRVQRETLNEQDGPEVGKV